MASSKDDFWNKVELLKHLARDKAQHMKGSIHGFVWSRVEYKGRWCDVCLASVAVKDIATYLAWRL